MISLQTKTSLDKVIEDVEKASSISRNDIFMECLQKKLQHSEELYQRRIQGAICYIESTLRLNQYLQEYTLAHNWGVEDDKYDRNKNMEAWIERKLLEYVNKETEATLKNMMKNEAENENDSEVDENE